MAANQAVAVDRIHEAAAMHPTVTLMRSGWKIAEEKRKCRRKSGVGDAE